MYFYFYSEIPSDIIFFPFYSYMHLFVIGFQNDLHSIVYSNRIIITYIEFKDQLPLAPSSCLMHISSNLNWDYSSL